MSRCIIVACSLALTVMAAPARADRFPHFKCQQGPLEALLGRTIWPRYTHNLENHRCSETQIDVARLARRWEINGLTGVTSVPVSVQNKLYFGDWDGVLHKVDAITGAPIWEVDIGSAPASLAGPESRSTPTVHGNRVYAASANALHAVDANTGAILWSTLLDTHFGTFVESSPIVIEGLVIIGVASFELILDLPQYTFRGGVVALDANTGVEVWRVYTTENNETTSGAGVSVWSSAAIDRQRHTLYIGTGQAYSAPASPLSDAVLAINYRTGTLVWTHQFTAGDIFTVPDNGPGPDFDIGATPNLITVNGRDLVTVGSKAGLFKAIDRDTGAMVWQRQLTQGSSLGGVMSSAATDGKRIYVVSNVWTAFGWISTNVHNPADTSVTFALDAATGNTIWSKPNHAPMFGAVALADGIVFHGLIDGTIYGLDANTGAVKFQDQAPGTIGSGFSIVDRRVYVSYGFNFFTGMTADAGILVYR